MSIVIELPLNTVLEEIERLAEDFVVNKDETKILLLKVIEQSIRDYNNLKKSKVPIEVGYFETARDFLFEKDYYILWGDLEITIVDILDYLNVEYEWFQRKIIDLVD